MPVIVKVDGDDAYEPTIHDLFNELHRRLCEINSAEDVPVPTAFAYLASRVDAAHHDYTDLTENT